MPLFVVDVNRTQLFGAPLPRIDAHTLASYASHIYEGCEFGCNYCDGWGRHLRPYNEQIRLMPDIAHAASAELATIDRRAVIGLTAESDAYQPAEQHYRRTRSVLRVLAEHGQPTVIMTKSPHVVDDIELLTEIHQRSLAMVMVTVMSHVVDVQNKLEDKNISTVDRFTTISQLKRAGIPVGVVIQPLIPYLNDTDYALSRLIEMSVAAGADFVHWDYIYTLNQRHRNRVYEALARIGNYPPSYMRNLYRDGMTIDPAYQQERNASLTRMCDDAKLPVHPPYAMFAQRLDPRNELELVILHQARRDMLQGRATLATIGQTLAARIAAGEMPLQELHHYAHYMLIRPAIQHVTGAAPFAD
jgi:DNA repair photolyase